MKVSEFRKLIREEVRRVLKEAASSPDKAYYMYLNGRNAVQGDPMSSTKEILEVGMEPSDVKNVGPVYMSKVTTNVGTYTTYLITSATNKKDNWFVVTPFDQKLADFDDENPESKSALYGMWLNAVANKSKAKQITFKDYLRATI